jgi:polyphenol oxidase
MKGSGFFGVVVIFARCYQMSCGSSRALTRTAKQPRKDYEMPTSPLSRTSELLSRAGFTHGFFLRRGGVSPGIFSSLNFTTTTGDSTENVERNLKIAAETLGVDARKIYFLSQVHGTGCSVVEGTEDREQVLATEGDVVITRKRGVAAAIRTADCVPILLGCTETGLVAACHAGWQGCVKQVVPATVEKLKSLGAVKLLAAVGPHISLASFEVSDDVAEQLLRASPDKDIVDHSFQKPHVHLRKMVHSQLRASGVWNDDIDHVEGCTVIEQDDFFSFRRDGNPSGRMLSAIVGRGSV